MDIVWWWGGMLLHFPGHAGIRQLRGRKHLSGARLGWGRVGWGRVDGEALPVFIHPSDVIEPGGPWFKFW